MKVLHVIAGLPQEGGGLSELVPAFARGASLLGIDVTVATVAADGDALSDAVQTAERCGVKVVRFAPHAPHKLYFSLKMLTGLRRLVCEADVVHVHSNWTFPVWWGCHLAIAHKKPLVMSPQGCLEPERLKRSAWKKRAAGWLFDRRYLRRATALHATCDAERRGVESYVRLGLSSHQTSDTPRGPVVCTIPNGVDVAALNGVKDRAWVDQRWPACSGKHVALSLSRITPIKGLDLLVSACGCLGDNGKDWQLLIAGPDERGYKRELLQLVNRLGLDSQVTFCDALYGADKIKMLRSCDLFVLPTRNDNFGIAVAEALACGVPVVTTKGAPWSELLGKQACLAEWRDSGAAEWQDSGVAGWQANKGLAKAESSAFAAHPATPANLATPANSVAPVTPAIAANGRCGWWVDIGVEPLAKALREAMGLHDEERHAMGENGRRLVESKYRWETVAAKMVDVYSRAAELKGGGEKRGGAWRK